MSSFKFFSLTPEEEEEEGSSYSISQLLIEEEDTCISWIDDSECQENLFQIISLTPEVAIIDKENHIVHSSYSFFFKELGYFTEEPEPIDPSYDYELEAKNFLLQRDKQTRKKHICLSRIPSLEYGCPRSGLSSSSSSVHHESQLVDIQSPYFMGVLSYPSSSSSSSSTATNNNYHLDTKCHPYQYRSNRVS
ncbi:uncharacterized protein BX663DRAFT_517480 [Cokeromyces recurvatus]|uniref:uncharacterized protein n=1 Tax=Cokeromyces recurvatus TaxID=90255 RepID=UPI002220932E|nr:uncharacterized protein BX663DRAFT_517480 [Cokeromyces recurvatus]KAI7900415.1 hypothetical protein BX663DRAFT_517480 [Cokeromyces recurvatus]